MCRMRLHSWCVQRQAITMPPRHPTLQHTLPLRSSLLKSQSRMSTTASAMLPPLASWLKVARVSANLSNAATSHRPACSATGGCRVRCAAAASRGAAKQSALAIVATAAAAQPGPALASTCAAPVSLLGPAAALGASRARLLDSKICFGAPMCSATGRWDATARCIVSAATARADTDLCVLSTTRRKSNKCPEN